jgi:Glycogen recognition site of AMP-activated protein kinase
MPPGRPITPVNLWIEIEYLPKNVYVKWSPDNWTELHTMNQRLAHTNAIRFEITLPHLKDGSRIEFKFIVDGDWRCNEQQRTEIVTGGYRNNVMWIADD